MGYKLAINTAQPTGLCCFIRMVQNTERAGVVYGKNVPTKMWMCRGWRLREKKAKISNMKSAMAYYRTTKKCMVLFDDDATNVRYMIGAGFNAVKVSIDAVGISAAESAEGLAMLEGCDCGAKTE
jgi:hypothetical protein